MVRHGTGVDPERLRDPEAVGDRQEHAVAGCPGTMRRVYNSPANLREGAPDALVCPECGAKRDVRPVSPDAARRRGRGEEDAREGATGGGGS